MPVNPSQFEKVVTIDPQYDGVVMFGQDCVFFNDAQPRPDGRKIYHIFEHCQDENVDEVYSDTFHEDFTERRNWLFSKASEHNVDNIQKILANNGICLNDMHRSYIAPSASPSNAGFLQSCSSTALQDYSQANSTPLSPHNACHPILDSHEILTALTKQKVGKHQVPLEEEIKKILRRHSTRNKVSPLNVQESSPTRITAMSNCSKAVTDEATQVYFVENPIPPVKTDDEIPEPTQNKRDLCKKKKFHSTFPLLRRELYKLKQNSKKILESKTQEVANISGLNLRSYSDDHRRSEVPLSPLLNGGTHKTQDEQCLSNSNKVYSTNEIQKTLTKKLWKSTLREALVGDECEITEKTIKNKRKPLEKSKKSTKSKNSSRNKSNSFKKALCYNVPLSRENDMSDPYEMSFRNDSMPLKKSSGNESFPLLDGQIKLSEICRRSDSMRKEAASLWTNEDLKSPEPKNNFKCKSLTLCPTESHHGSKFDGSYLMSSKSYDTKILPFDEDIVRRVENGEGENRECFGDLNNTETPEAHFRKKKESRECSGRFEEVFKCLKEVRVRHLPERKGNDGTWNCSNSFVKEENSKLPEYQQNLRQINGKSDENKWRYLKDSSSQFQSLSTGFNNEIDKSEDRMERLIEPLQNGLHHLKNEMVRYNKEPRLSSFENSKRPNLPEYLHEEPVQVNEENNGDDCEHLEKDFGSSESLKITRSNETNSKGCVDRNEVEQYLLEKLKISEIDNSRPYSFEGERVSDCSKSSNQYSSQTIKSDMDTHENSAKISYSQSLTTEFNDKVDKSVEFGKRIGGFLENSEVESYSLKNVKMDEADLIRLNSFEKKESKFNEMFNQDIGPTTESKNEDEYEHSNKKSYPESLTAGSPDKFSKSVEIEEGIDDPFANNTIEKPDSLEAQKFNEPDSSCHISFTDKESECLEEVHNDARQKNGNYNIDKIVHCEENSYPDSKIAESSDEVENSMNFEQKIIQPLVNTVEIEQQYSLETLMINKMKLRGTDSSLQEREFEVTENLRNDTKQIDRRYSVDFFGNSVDTSFPKSLTAEANKIDECVKIATDTMENIEKQESLEKVNYSENDSGCLHSPLNKEESESIQKPLTDVEQVTGNDVNVYGFSKENSYPYSWTDDSNNEVGSLMECEETVIGTKSSLEVEPSLGCVKLDEFGSSSNSFENKAESSLMKPNDEDSVQVDGKIGEMHEHLEEDVYYPPKSLLTDFTPELNQFQYGLKNICKPMINRNEENQYVPEKIENFQPKPLYCNVNTRHSNISFNISESSENEKVESKTFLQVSGTHESLENYGDITNTKNESEISKNSVESSSFTYDKTDNELAANANIRNSETSNDERLDGIANVESTISSNSYIENVEESPTNEHIPEFVPNGSDGEAVSSQILRDKWQTLDAAEHNKVNLSVNSVSNLEAELVNNLNEETKNPYTDFENEPCKSTLIEKGENEAPVFPIDSSNPTEIDSSVCESNNNYSKLVPFKEQNFVRVNSLPVGPDVSKSLQEEKMADASEGAEESLKNSFELPDKRFEEASNCSTNEAVQVDFESHAVPEPIDKSWEIVNTDKVPGNTCLEVPEQEFKETDDKELGMCASAEDIGKEEATPIDVIVEEKPETHNEQDSESEKLDEVLNEVANSLIDFCFSTSVQDYPETYISTPEKFSSKPEKIVASNHRKKRRKNLPPKQRRRTKGRKQPPDKASQEIRCPKSKMQIKDFFCSECEFSTNVKWELNIHEFSHIKMSKSRVTRCHTRKSSYDSAIRNHNPALEVFDLPKESNEESSEKKDPNTDFAKDETRNSENSELKHTQNPAMEMLTLPKGDNEENCEEKDPNVEFGEDEAFNSENSELNESCGEKVPNIHFANDEVCSCEYSELKHTPNPAMEVFELPKDGKDSCWDKDPNIEFANDEACSSENFELKQTPNPLMEVFELPNEVKEESCMKKDPNIEFDNDETCSSENFEFKQTPNSAMEVFEFSEEDKAENCGEKDPNIEFANDEACNSENFELKQTPNPAMEVFELTNEGKEESCGDKDPNIEFANDEACCSENFELKQIPNPAMEVFELPEEDKAENCGETDPNIEFANDEGCSSENFELKQTPNPAMEVFELPNEGKEVSCGEKDPNIEFDNDETCSSENFDLKQTPNPAMEVFELPNEGKEVSCGEKDPNIEFDNDEACISRNFELKQTPNLTMEVFELPKDGKDESCGKMDRNIEFAKDETCNSNSPELKHKPFNFDTVPTAKEEVYKSTQRGEAPSPSVYLQAVESVVSFETPGKESILGESMSEGCFPPSEERTLKCSFVDKVWHSSNLVFKLKKSFCCTSCDYSTNVKWELVLHELSHFEPSNERNLRCNRNKREGVSNPKPSISKTKEEGTENEVTALPTGVKAKDIGTKDADQFSELNMKSHELVSLDSAENVELGHGKFLRESNRSPHLPCQFGKKKEKSLTITSSKSSKVCLLEKETLNGPSDKNVKSEQKSFSCVVCNFSTNVKWDLTIHVFAHSKVKSARSMRSSIHLENQTLALTNSTSTDFNSSSNFGFNTNLCIDSADTTKESSSNNDLLDTNPNDKTKDKSSAFSSISIQKVESLACNAVPTTREKSNKRLPSTPVKRQLRIQPLTPDIEEYKTKTGSKRIKSSLQDRSLQNKGKDNLYRAPKTKFNCSRCNFSTSIAKIYRQHKLRHLNDNHPKQSKNPPALQLKRLFQCEKCSYSSTNSSHLKEHLTVHSNLRPFKCSYCDFASKLKSNLRKHERKHQKYGELSKANYLRCKLLYCSKCTYSTPFQRILNLHIEESHRKQERKKEFLSCRKRKFECTKCNYSCNDKRAKRKHDLKHAECKNESDVEIKPQVNLHSSSRVGTKRKQDKSNFLCHTCNSLIDTNISSKESKVHDLQTTSFQCMECKSKESFKKPKLETPMEIKVETLFEEQELAIYPCETSPLIKEGTLSYGDSVSCNSDFKPKQDMGQYLKNGATPEWEPSSKPSCKSYLNSCDITGIKLENPDENKIKRKRKRRASKIERRRYRCRICRFVTRSKFRLKEHAMIHKKIKNEMETSDEFFHQEGNSHSHEISFHSETPIETSLNVIKSEVGATVCSASLECKRQVKKNSSKKTICSELLNNTSKANLGDADSVSDADELIQSFTLKNTSVIKTTSESRESSPQNIEFPCSVSPMPGIKIEQEQITLEKETFPAHVKSSKKSKKFYECKTCPYLATSIKNFKRHNKSHLETDVSLKNSEKLRKSPSKMFSCKQCGNSYTLKRNLDQHLRTKHLSANEILKNKNSNKKKTFRGDANATSNCSEDLKIKRTTRNKVNSSDLVSFIDESLVTDRNASKHSMSNLNISEIYSPPMEMKIPECNIKNKFSVPAQPKPKGKRAKFPRPVPDLNIKKTEDGYPTDISIKNKSCSESDNKNICNFSGPFQNKEDSSKPFGDNFKALGNRLKRKSSPDSDLGVNGQSNFMKVGNGFMNAVDSSQSGKSSLTNEIDSSIEELCSKANENNVSSETVPSKDIVSNLTKSDLQENVELGTCITPPILLQCCKCSYTAKTKAFLKIHEFIHSEKNSFIHSDRVPNDMEDRGMHPKFAKSLPSTSIGYAKEYENVCRSEGKSDSNVNSGDEFSKVVAPQRRRKIIQSKSQVSRNICDRINSNNFKCLKYDKVFRTKRNMSRRKCSSEESLVVDTSNIKSENKSELEPTVKEFEGNCIPSLGRVNRRKSSSEKLKALRAKSSKIHSRDFYLLKRNSDSLNEGSLIEIKKHSCKKQTMLDQKPLIAPKEGSEKKLKFKAELEKPKLMNLKVLFHKCSKCSYGTNLSRNFKSHLKVHSKHN